MIRKVWKRILTGYFRDSNSSRVHFFCLISGREPPSTLVHNNEYSMIISNSCEWRIIGDFRNTTISWGYAYVFFDNLNSVSHIWNW